MLVAQVPSDQGLVAPSQTRARPAHIQGRPCLSLGPERFREAVLKPAYPVGGTPAGVRFPDCHRLCGPGCLRDSRAVAPSAAPAFALRALSAHSLPQRVECMAVQARRRGGGGRRAGWWRGGTFESTRAVHEPGESGAAEPQLAQLAQGSNGTTEGRVSCAPADFCGFQADFPGLKPNNPNRGPLFGFIVRFQWVPFLGSDWRRALPRSRVFLSSPSMRKAALRCRA